MVSIRSVLRTIPDPQGKKGRLHRLDAILSLILLSMLSDRKGMKAAFHPGRGLSRKHLDRLGFRRDRKSPCHATLTETLIEALRVLDPDVMATVFAQVTVDPSRDAATDTDPRQIAMPNMFFRPSVLASNTPLAIGHLAAKGGTRPKQGMDALTCATSTCCRWTRSPNTCAPYGRRFAQVPASRAAARMSGPEIS